MEKISKGSKYYASKPEDYFARRIVLLARELNKKEYPDLYDKLVKEEKKKWIFIFLFPLALLKTLTLFLSQRCGYLLLSFMHFMFDFMVIASIYVLRDNFLNYGTCDIDDIIVDNVGIFFVDYYLIFIIIYKIIKLIIYIHFKVQEQKIK